MWTENKKAMKPLQLVLCCIFFSITTFMSAQMEVMSYNIRFLTENDGENSWSYRKDYITNQLKFYEPDILGVQEAVYEQLQHFDSAMEDYRYVGVGRDKGDNEGEFSAIFYNTKKFEVLEEDTFWLSETPEKPSKGWDAALPRVCTWVLLQKKSSGEKFYVFNTHFDHIGEQAREESARLIMEQIERINEEDHPVILMGDLNLEPDSNAVRFLSEEMNDSKLVAEKVAFGPEGTFNGYRFDEPVTRRIDYIFTDDNFRVLKYAVLSDSKDLKYPSDHLPVLVELELK